MKSQVARSRTCHKILMHLVGHADCNVSGIVASTPSRTAVLRSMGLSPIALTCRRTFRLYAFSRALLQLTSEDWACGSAMDAISCAFSGRI